MPLFHVSVETIAASSPLNSCHSGDVGKCAKNVLFPEPGAAGSATRGLHILSPLLTAFARVLLRSCNRLTMAVASTGRGL